MSRSLHLNPRPSRLDVLLGFHPLSVACASLPIGSLDPVIGCLADLPQRDQAAKAFVVEPNWRV